MVELMKNYHSLLYHLFLNHFLFRLNLLLLMVNEDMDQHDAKILFYYLFIIKIKKNSFFYLFFNYLKSKYR